MSRRRPRHALPALLPRVQLAGSLPSGPIIVPDVSLHADGHGVHLRDPDGCPVHTWPWPEVHGWDASAVARDAAGTHRQVLVLRAAGGRHRILVDAPDLAPFLRALAAGASRQARRRGRTRRSWRVLGARRSILGAACVAAVVGAAGGTPALLQGPPTTTGAVRLVNADLARSFGGAQALHLAPATAPPAPAPPSVQAAAPLAPHEALGFAPYWALAHPASIDTASLTTIAYFGVDVTASGHVDQSPTNPGWVGYQSQALADLVTAAHGAGKRVVLTATCFDQAALDHLTHSPAAQATLAASLVALVRAKNLDGVNLDFEGTGAADRVGLDSLVAAVGHTLRTADAHWQFTMDTYGSSASDPAGFYDVAGLAPSVDALVVMAYGMGSAAVPGPTAALAGPGSTDRQVAASYAAVAGAGKVILGIPMYGYDWPTAGPAAGDAATGPPVAVAAAQIAPSDTVYWDPTTSTPWAVYRVGTQWHQVWFDNPASLAAKDRLVHQAGLRGAALWALGMAGPADQAAALTGAWSGALPPDGPVVAPGTGAVPGQGVAPGTVATAANAPAASPRTVPGQTGVPGSPGSSGAGAGGTGNGSGTSGSGAATASGAATGAGASGSGASGSGGGASGSGGGPVGSAGAVVAIGIFEGNEVSLHRWSGPAPHVGTSVGTLTGYAATVGVQACLSAGPPLVVSPVTGTRLDMVVATTPVDCTSGTWVFTVAASPGGAGSAGSTSSGGLGRTAGTSAATTGAGSVGATAGPVAGTAPTG